MKSIFSAVTKALKDKPGKVAMTAPWKEMHANWGVGRKIGPKLQLSPSDFDLMHQRAIQEYGADPLGLDRDKDRTELSADTSNEKLTYQRAFGRLLRVVVPGHGVMIGPPPGNAGLPTLIPMPRGVLLSVEPDQLVLETEKIYRVW